MKFIYNDNDVNSMSFGSLHVNKVYYNGYVYQYAGIPDSGGQHPCFDVTDNISTYSSTTYDMVFDTTQEKWYMLNNLSQYEEYGIYDNTTGGTYYDGKLAIVDGHEYEYSGNTWVDVGEVTETTIPDNYVIQFEDSAVKTICVNNWGGNVVSGELTYGEAKAVTSLGNVFKNNTTITKFNELTYFHGLSAITNGEFVGCTNLREIVIPSNVTSIGANGSNVTFSGCTNLSGLTFLSGSESLTLMQVFSNRSYWMNSSNQSTPIVFPNRPITFDNSKVFFAYADYCTTGYFQTATPPVGLASADIANYRKLATIYCPIGASAAYTAALNGLSKTVIEYDFSTDANNVLNREKQWTIGNVTTYPMYYDEISDPADNVVFSSMTAALAYECPWIGMTATIAGEDYIFGDNDEWLEKYGLFEVTGEYLCNAGNKYKKMEEKVRNVDGSWSSQTPAVYEIGDLIEAQSEDCASILPDGYTEVEYVSTETYSSGTSAANMPYINTNYTPNNNTRVVCKFQYTANQLNRRLLGSGVWNTSNAYVVEAENTITETAQATLYLRYGGSNSWITTSQKIDKNVHTIDYNKNLVYFDNTLVTTCPANTFTANYNMVLFGFMTNSFCNGSNEAMIGRIYYCKIYDNDIIVRDYVACIRNSDNKVGFYDIANDVFYPSANSSYNFKAGDPVL